METLTNIEQSSLEDLLNLLPKSLFGVINNKRYESFIHHLKITKGDEYNEPNEWQICYEANSQNGETSVFLLSSKENLRDAVIETLQKLKIFGYVG